MSNALSRKRKKMQPIGYKEEVHVFNQQAVRRLNYAKELGDKTFSDTKLIAYQILHDKFGFGLKRIERLGSGVEAILQKKVPYLKLVDYLEEEKEIDLSDVDVPQRELLAFQNVPYNNYILPLQNKINVIAGAVSDYIVLSVVVLKEQFKFSKNQIMEYVGWICYYINSLATGYETMLGVASVLACECKYYDPRFIGKTYEV